MAGARQHADRRGIGEAESPISGSTGCRKKEPPDLAWASNMAFNKATPPDPSQTAPHSLMTMESTSHAPSIRLKDHHWKHGRPKDGQDERSERPKLKQQHRDMTHFTTCIQWEAQACEGRGSTDVEANTTRVDCMLGDEHLHGLSHLSSPELSVVCYAF